MSRRKIQRTHRDNKTKPGGWFSTYKHEIPRHRRLHKLQSYLQIGTWIKRDLLEKRRKEFNQMKDLLLPLENAVCYICPARATHRHHLVPLCRGGENSIDNLTGLCERCHGKLNIISKTPAHKRHFKVLTHVVYKPAKPALSSYSGCVFVNL